MKWDPELTALADQVRETFGRRALADAYVRALMAAPRTECPPELELFEEDDEIRGARSLCEHGRGKPKREFDAADEALKMVPRALRAAFA
jgi:hypothetical protein